MATVRWTVGARDDLREIVEYISHDSPTYAVATAGRMLDAVEQLRRHPRLGRVVPEYEDQRIRELVVGSYRIVYHVQRQQVGILAVVRGSRDLLRRLGREPWDLG